MAAKLSGGAIFSGIHTCLLLLFLVHFDYLSIVGKFYSWPFTVYLLLGVVINASILHTKGLKIAPKTKPANIKLRKFFKSITVLLISVLIFYIIAVLFGAPFFSSQEETLMFSILLTTLIVLPLILNLGLDATVSILSSTDVFEKETLSTIFAIAVRFVLFGAWLGAVVIPLDWDRPWQKWPISCCFGALVGYVVSQMFILSLNVPKIAQVFNQMLIKKGRKYEL